MREKADAILREHDVLMSGSGGHGTLNLIIYDVEVVDAEVLAQIARDTGGAIRLNAFIEVLSHDLAQLPAPPPRGDFPLVTKTRRSGGFMHALGVFTLHFDAEKRCMYFDNGSERRVLPVWPFGFWATSNPLRIYDYDDNLVAQEGDTVEMGGGYAEVEHAHAENPCGAKSAWFGHFERAEAKKRRVK